MVSDVARPISTARRELGNELRRLRGDRRAAGVASALGWSESKLSRIETAHTGITENDLERLLTAYGVRVEDRDRLRELAQPRPDATGLVDPLPVVGAGPLRRIPGRSRPKPCAISEWEAQVVPGLLQTDEYARAVIEVGRRRGGPRAGSSSAGSPCGWPGRPCSPGSRRPAADHRGRGGPPPRGRRARRAAPPAARLVEASKRPGVELLVLPFSAGAHAGLTEAFMIFEFAEGTRAPWCTARTDGRSVPGEEQRGGGLPGRLRRPAGTGAAPSEESRAAHRP